MSNLSRRTLLAGAAALAASPALPALPPPTACWKFVYAFDVSPEFSQLGTRLFSFNLMDTTTGRIICSKLSGTEDGEDLGDPVEAAHHFNELVRRFEETGSAERLGHIREWQDPLRPKNETVSHLAPSPPEHAHHHHHEHLEHLRPQMSIFDAATPKNDTVSLLAGDERNDGLSHAAAREIKR